MKPGWYVLLYHDVSWEENPFTRGIGGTCPPDVFRDHLSCLKRVGEVVGVAEGLERLRRGGADRPLFTVWFDDGLVGVRRYARPLLADCPGAVSICSRFLNREELFWRFQLSYLSSIDGLRFLRSRLRKHGYRRGQSILEFTMDRFGESIVAAIRETFERFTSEPQRRDAFRMFETHAGLRDLLGRGWTLANHTAAHYPVGEEEFLGEFERQFDECEAAYRELTGEDSAFWVLPFYRPTRLAAGLIETFRRCGGDRHLVLVGDRVNTASTLATKVVYRFSVPVCSGRQLIRFLKRETRRKKPALPGLG